MAITSSVDPAAQQVLDQIAAAPGPDHPLSETERVSAFRAAYAGATQLAGEPEAVASVEDQTIAGARGAIPVRIYRPSPGTTAGPALIWLHGGGFIAGDLDTHDAPLRAIANRIGFPVLAVAWSLAPEHPYPAGLEDAFAVLQSAARGEAMAGIDPARLAIGGDSAGGGLAAALAFVSRARHGPPIAAQVLVYPNTDLTGDWARYPSWTEHDGRVLDRGDMERNFALYAGDADRTQPGISPIRAANLAGLPPTLMITGEADPQRDEGEAYASRLREAGVPVDHTRYPGMIHGFLQMAGALRAGREAIDEIGQWLAPLGNGGVPGR